MEVGGVMLYETHQKLVSRLMYALNMTPPPGYAKVSYSQLRAADEMAFRLLERETHSGIQETSATRTNVDDAMDGVLKDAMFTQLLAFLPSLKRGGAGDDEDNKKRRKGKGKGKEQGGKNQWQQPWGYPVEPKGKNKGGKGKNKKGKDGPRSPMPRELIGGVHMTTDKEPICFNYNLRCGCNNAQPGAFCPKGKHVCCVAGCFDTHPFHAHVVAGAGA